MTLDERDLLLSVAYLAALGDQRSYITFAGGQYSGSFAAALGNEDYIRLAWLISRVVFGDDRLFVTVN